MSPGEEAALLARIAADRTITPQVMRSPRDPSEQAATRELIHRGFAAFNRGDMQRAFSGLPEDLEWEFAPSAFDFGTIRGRQQVCRRFEETIDTFGYQVEIEDYADDGAQITMRLHGRFRARHTGLAMDLVFTQTWDWDGNRLLVREREIEAETGIDTASADELRT